VAPSQNVEVENAVKFGGFGRSTAMQYIDLEGKKFSM